MKTKRMSLYIVSVVLLVIMILGSLGVATWALLSTKLNVSGNIGFTGTGDVMATVANGKVEGGTLADQASKLEDLKIEAEGVTSGSVDSWKELQLAFTNSEDVTLSFSIKNDLPESSGKYLQVDLNADFGAQDYITASVTAAGKGVATRVKIAPQEIVTYNIVFAVKPETNVVTSLRFDLLFNMVNTTEAPTVYQYSLLGDDTYEISAGSDCAGDITIPNTYEGKKVTKIAANGFRNCTGITSLTLNSNLTIGDNAFSGCTGMTVLKFTTAWRTITVGANVFDTDFVVDLSEFTEASFMLEIDGHGYWSEDTPAPADLNNKTLTITPWRVDPPPLVIEGIE